MTIQVAVNHRTEYVYDRSVTISPHVFRLRPAAHCRTPIDAYSLKINPDNHFINWQQDPFGNYLARVVFPEKARSLTVEVDLIATMTVINPFDFFYEKSAEKYPFQYSDSQAEELKPYLKITENGPKLLGRMDRIDRRRRPTNDFLVELNQKLNQEIDYTIRMKPGVQTCEETLTKARGSCRDSAWLLVQILRHLGLAARFVSGYLIQLTTDVKPLEGPSGPENDFTDLHAWAEVYVPGAGWLGLDPTPGLFAGEGHIPLACAPDPKSAAPVEGATDPCEVTFRFHNAVQRIHEDPRVTKPYSDDQWETIQALGDTVDQALQDHDVRLSMGGEPTFVSIDDMESAQWNTAADGPHKRERAEDLIRRLYSAFAGGGILHYGQGKWYPGELLPRWQLSCVWRKDGIPIWRQPELLADPQGATDTDATHALRLFTELAKVLDINPSHICAGYEDPMYHIWQESNLPPDVDPLAVDLDDPIERQKLAKVLDGRLGSPLGYALPLRWFSESFRWDSSPWEFRRQRMFLMPGNSPMGFRLPLDALPWTARHEVDKDSPDDSEDDTPPTIEELADKIGPPQILPPLADRIEQGARPAASRSPTSSIRKTGKADKAAVEIPVAHTALCVESRDGCLYVFLPPADDLEAYLALLTAVETAAVRLEQPVVLEGYLPPDDHRISSLMVTPDPGVVEVNIQPAESWQELVSNTETLYEEARKARLATEKFMVDGRQTGTGGGNHVTLGCPTPADSPMLRRPELLRSLITYWQHHPGLSYLFSGHFVGPTSQAPRVDEARDEQLYELEIAFGQMPRGDTDQYWLTDRLLRNLLIDASGNTHRSEFSIDKLYPLEPGGRRLGIVELRAFDMPPHHRMSLVQMLLLRALIARFWQEPYEKPLVRWGTELHDRFMLPHYVCTDIRDVVDDLQRSGYGFYMSWLDPFFEFRFPKYGAVQINDIHLELRAAIEPWHVLGEEITSFGTARYVDSSMERIQMRVRGLTDSRYVVTCNGRRIPLNNTGTRGEYVGGVRYRAWQPSSALHPTIGIDSPLVFDVVDTWNGRAVGGCTYHVSHPGGRSYETFPVNAYEAESRRVNRFWNYGYTPGVLQPPPVMSDVGRFVPHGHRPGPMAPPVEEVNADFPHTLDLRRRADSLG